MRKVHKCILFVFAFIGFSQAWAQAPINESPPLIPETVMLDGTEYTRDEIADLFLQAAIAEYELPDKGWESFTAIPEAEMKVRYPWISPFIFREDGLPKSGVINKWPVKEVAVSVGYPNRLKEYDQPWWFWWKKEFMRYYNFADHVYYGSPFVNMIEIETMQVVDELKELNLPVRLGYISPEFPQERKAQIRIIPFGQTLEVKENPKYYGLYMVTENDWTNAEYIHLRNLITKKTITNFKFTPDQKEFHVEGYVLTNANNEIKLSICYIYEGHSAPVRQFLVKECILRSLGLVNALGDTDSFLSSQNITDDHQVQNEGLSELDIYLLKLLYHPSITAENSTQDITAILKGENEN